MPTYSDDYQKIEAASKKAREASKLYGTLSAQSRTLGEDVMKNVRKARAERGVGQLSKDIGVTTGQIVSEPAKIRERTAGLDPLKQDVITASQRGQTLRTLATTADVGEKREGTIEGILKEGANKLLAHAALKKSEADASTQEANTLLSVLGAKMEEERLRISRMPKGPGGMTPSQQLDYLIKLKKFTESDMPELTAGVKTKAGGYMTLLDDLKRIRDLSSGAGGGKSWLGDIFGGATGPAAKFKGAYWGKEGANYRTALNQLEADIKHEKYGGALTEQEIKESRKWAPSSGRQETENIARLDDLIVKKETQLWNHLKSQGLGENQIGEYIQTGQFSSEGGMDFSGLLQLLQGGGEGGDWVLEGAIQ